MAELAFPPGFLWGTATAAHQVEGGNSDSDWWEWELKPGTPCKEPSGAAIDHYNRYGRDVETLAGLGFNTYRFSVEWARIEPSEGVFDETQLEHYRRMVAAVRNCKLVPMVTLNHFTLPIWVAKQGGWLAEATPALFERYVRRAVEALGEAVDWYCTINEPGVVAFGGYMGALGFPPGTHGLANWKRAARGLIQGHRRARAAVKEFRPGAHVGQTHSMQEWESNAGGRPAMEYARRMGEDIYLEASKEDDFVGVQTYTRARLDMPRPIGWLAKAALAVDPIEKLVVSQTVGRQTGGNPTVDARDGIRRTRVPARGSGCDGPSSGRTPAGQADSGHGARRRHGQRRGTRRVHHRGPEGPSRSPGRGYPSAWLRSLERLRQLRVGARLRHAVRPHRRRPGHAGANSQAVGALSGRDRQGQLP